jgi:methanethiol S-methyltransferase
MDRIQRSSALAFGAFSYAIFFATFLYFVGFIGGFGVPKTVDSGSAGSLATALAVDVALIALFGVQHTLMARPRFKAAWTRVVPRTIERSVYVLLSSAVLLFLYWQWRPIPTAIWQVESGVGRAAVLALYFGGYATVLYASFLIDHFDLFGLRQVFLHWRARAYTEKAFRVRGAYRLVRHPLYVGWIVAFWATPTLTVGHLLFAAGMTAYILVAIRFEERDLAALHGEPYRRWRERTPALVPRLPGAAQPPVAEAS